MERIKRVIILAQLQRIGELCPLRFPRTTAGDARLHIAGDLNDVAGHIQEGRAMSEFLDTETYNCRGGVLMVRSQRE
jgi:hypothetical protein